MGPKVRKQDVPGGTQTRNQAVTTRVTPQRGWCSDRGISDVAAEDSGRESDKAEGGRLCVDSVCAEGTGRAFNTAGAGEGVRKSLGH